MSDFDPFLLSLGWNDFFQRSYDEINQGNVKPGRIVGQARGHYDIKVASETILQGNISSKDRHKAKESTDFPAVGDWVAWSFEEGTKKARIQHVLERKSSIQRKRAGSAHQAQLIAANVDYMLIVTSLNEDFDLGRLKRYVALAQESRTAPVIVLTKADLCSDRDRYASNCKAEFKNAGVFLISNQDYQSIESLQSFFTPGKTSILLGSSGVGKSTLANYLLGSESQKTGSVSFESKGRHTTTSRNLLHTRWGGLVIDTPGMQDVLVIEESEPQKDFSEIEDLMLQCKFTNCQHKTEPGCAVTKALKSGTLLQNSWSEYLESLTAQRSGKNKQRR